MKKTVFEGMATAIVTPMTRDGIDYDALGRFIELQIESGINAIVVMGTTGENATIEYADQKEIIRIPWKRWQSGFLSSPVPEPTIQGMFCTIQKTPARWVPMPFWW